MLLYVFTYIVLCSYTKVGIEMIERQMNTELLI